MSLLTGLLTVVLVLDCLLLILLVLVQLPKKEAGAGLAFGGAATDALFGAGSGNVLTKVTKYAAVTFFVLAMILAFFQSKAHSDAEKAKGFSEAVEQAEKQPAPASAPRTTSSAAPASVPASTNFLLPPGLPLTNAPATNTPGAEAAPQK